MQGAREYATLFETGQHGKLYLVSGEHARGKTFHIWILPSADPVQAMPWTVRDAVKVYGVTGGNPGWTETYGWLHRGKWEQDFAALVETRKAEIAAAASKREREIADAAEAEQRRKAALLDAY